MKNGMRQLLLLLMVVIFSACSGDDEAKRVEREQAAAKRDEYQKKREAEVALMSNLATAVPALEGRIRDWITVQGGLLIVHEPVRLEASRHSWQVMPTSVPWYVSCAGGMVRVTIGSWVSGDREDVYETFNVKLADTLLPDDQCRTLAIKVAERLALILKGA